MYWRDSRDKEVVQSSKILDSATYEVENAAYEIEEEGSLANDLSKANRDRRDKVSSRDREHRAKRPRSR
eukprot:9461-Eustigmatos_ZCMA.PRE.1